MAELELRLVAAATDYGPREPLRLRAWLRNRGAAPVVVLRRASHVDLSLCAVSAEGQPLIAALPPAPPRPPTRADLATVAPGDAVELEPFELLGRTNGQLVKGHGRPGTFTVTAQYFAGVGCTANLCALDPAAFVGRLSSNAVVVTLRAA